MLTFWISTYTKGPNRIQAHVIKIILSRDQPVITVKPLTFLYMSVNSIFKTLFMNSNQTTTSKQYA